MSKKSYKGATLKLVFATPTPDVGDRVPITGYTFTATVQGFNIPVETIDEYSFKIFLDESRSNRLMTTEVPIIVKAKKENNVLIGRNTDLVCVDPVNGLPIPDLDSETEMDIIFSEGAEISLEMSLANIPMSPFEMWLESHPDGTQAEFLASIINPTHEGPAPEYNNSPGKKGEIRMDEAYLYVCVGTNTWKTVELMDDVLTAIPTTTPAPATTTTTTGE